MKESSNDSANPSRRKFIRNAAIASSVFIVPRHVLGGPGFIAPSDQLNLAAIGAGGKGASDIRNASVNGRERVIALCDVALGGYAKASVERFQKAKLYADFRERRDKEKDIDDLQISTPDHAQGSATWEERGVGKKGAGTG